MSMENDGDYFFESRYRNRSHKQRQTDGTWPRQSSTQMDPSLHLSTCVDNRVGPSNMDTDVMSATTSPTPKLEWRERRSKIKLAELSQSIFLVPFVDNVKALFRLLWILAIVDSQCLNGNASA